MLLGREDWQLPTTIGLIKSNVCQTDT